MVSFVLHTECKSETRVIAATTAQWHCALEYEDLCENESSQ